MDGFTEKKWFVYVVDHHEGPFSLADIQVKLTQGQVTVSNYIWAEGMSDWKLMTEIPAFASILSPPAPAVALSPAALPAIETVAQLTPIITATKPISPEPAPVQVEVHGAAQLRHSRLPGRLKWLIVAILLAMLGGLYQFGFLESVTQGPAFKAAGQTVSDFTEPYLMNLVETIPVLGQWISPIPKLDDVSIDDYEDLKSAATGKVEEKGPKVAFALAHADLFFPQFYVASNLPDGAEFEVYVEGVPETLLNQLNFSAQVKANIVKRLGKTASVKFQDGKPVPRGEYTVYIMEAEQQPELVKSTLASVAPSNERISAALPKGRKLISKKTYFLGGNKDATYVSRLKEFHEKLKTKADAELNEIKQFSATLESQLGTSVTEFTRLKSKKSNKALQKAWSEFHDKWSRLDEQLGETFKKWTPEALGQDYFYGLLYKQVLDLGQAISRVHGIHHAYFTGAVDAKSFDIQLGEATSQAQTAFSAIKSKIEQAEKLVPAPSGMPRREGL
jgi:hypothetical protein